MAPTRNQDNVSSLARNQDNVSSLAWNQDNVSSLAQNQDNVSSFMSTHGLLFQWASTIKIQLSISLEQNRYHHLIEMQPILPMIYLKNCSLGIQQQLHTHKFLWSPLKQVEWNKTQKMDLKFFLKIFVFFNFVHAI